MMAQFLSCLSGSDGRVAGSGAQPDFLSCLSGSDVDATPTFLPDF